MSQDQFQVIDTQAQSSLYQQVHMSIIGERNKPIIRYHAQIKQGKKQIDLNLLENQYYLVIVKKDNNQFCSIQRRFSQFQLIFQILKRKSPGYIFPAFPQNGIFTFMKTKLTFNKDNQLLNRRMKVIQRFFNKILNQEQFNPEICGQIKQFLSLQRQFQARKQMQKNNKGYLNMFSWNKIKNLIVSSKDKKYIQEQIVIQKLQEQYNKLCINTKSLYEYLKQEKQTNNKLFQSQLMKQKIKKYEQKLNIYKTKRQQNILLLQQQQFKLFCEIQDIEMVKNIFLRIDELKNDEDNYQQLNQIYSSLKQKLKYFIEQKQDNLKQKQLNFKQLIHMIKLNGRMLQ